ncbi:MAG: M14 family metallopeptidase [Alphaproteobacteria bacterium]
MAPKVELEAPDITPYRTGNTGIDYVTTFRARASGPHVMVNALTHGNELCGAIALDRLFRHDIRPKRGTLTLSFANVAAYEAFDPKNPTASRFVDEDFNRVWSEDMLEGPRDSTELRRARVMRPIVDAVDILLDIHSMQRLSAPLSLAGPTAKGRALATRMGVPVTVVSDEGHAAGVRLRDYAAFADPASSKSAALVECGQHWKRETAAVAIESLFRFLLCLDVIDREVAAEHLPPTPPPPQRYIEVTHAITITDEPFVFTAPYDGLEVIERAGTVIARDGQREVCTPYDRCVLVMPSQRLSRGLTAVRLGRYVS